MFALSQKLTDNKCQKPVDVGAWVNKVQTQYHELKLLSFELNALCADTMINGLPDRVTSIVNGVWTMSMSPGIKYAWSAILGINAGQMDCMRNKALAA